MDINYFMSEKSYICNHLDIICFWERSSLLQLICNKTWTPFKKIDILFLDDIYFFVNLYNHWLKWQTDNSSIYFLTNIPVDSYHECARMCEYVCARMCACLHPLTLKVSFLLKLIEEKLCRLLFRTYRPLDKKQNIF